MGLLTGPITLTLYFLKDFVSCIEAIHNEGYSSPSLTAIFGSSAGGFPVAMMCNKSPSLVGAAVLKVANILVSFLQRWNIA